MQFAFTPKRRLGPMNATSDLLQLLFDPWEWRRLPLDCISHLSGMNLEIQFEMHPFAPSFLRQPAEPMPPPIKEPPSPMENPDAPVREPDPEEPEQI